MENGEWGWARALVRALMVVYWAALVEFGMHRGWGLILVLGFLFFGFGVVVQISINFGGEVVEGAVPVSGVYI